MPPDAPSFLPVPPYASQYLRVATNLRSPFSEPVNLRMSPTNIHDRPHNLWSSPHHLRSFIGSVTQMSGDSEIQRLGDSEIRCLGDPALWRFGDSVVRRFAATTEQPPKEPWKLRPRPALSHPRLRLAMVLMDQTLSREFTALCPSRTTPVAIQASPRAGSGLLPPALGASFWSPRPSTSTPKPGHTTPKAPRGFSVFLASFGVSEPQRSELRRSWRSAIPLGNFGDSEVHSHSRTTSEALSASAFRGFLVFLCFDAAALRSLGDFGGSQPLMNLRGPWCLGVTTPRRFGASAVRRFGVSLFRSFSQSQNLRCRNISTFRSFSTSELRRFGVSVFRCFGVSVFRSLGASEFHSLAAPNPLDVDPNPRGCPYAVFPEVVGLHPDPPELWLAFRSLRLNLRISDPLGLGLRGLSASHALYPGPLPSVTLRVYSDTWARGFLTSFSKDSPLPSADSGAELLKMRLRKLLNDVRLKPVAKLDSIIESSILLGQAHTSDTIICANLQVGFYLEPGSQTERKVCQLLSVDAERKNVSFSTPGHGTVLTKPDVSPMAILSQSSTARQVPNMSISTGPQAAHAVPPPAATLVAPSSTSPGPTFSANRSAPIHS
ncbi:hypothetical protein GGX14DRAFT_389338 [Mycena pura]|uniref:Uncharacterized protein n=1 Tax=Mycena pura TaxID=153505 RepID=A0AAD6VQB4_9AGAR|nr:hypothetical protein GGX14DRAFT_389338 [Mycena pura]